MARRVKKPDFAEIEEKALPDVEKDLEYYGSKEVVKSASRQWILVAVMIAVIIIGAITLISMGR